MDNPFAPAGPGVPSEASAASGASAPSDGSASPFAPPRWLVKYARRDDLSLQPVLATRVRLARNLADRPFWNSCSPSEARALRDELAPTLDALPKAPAILVDSSSTLEARTLLSESLRLPTSLARRTEPGPWEARESLDRHRGILVHDEDHLRLWALRPGLAASEALDSLDDWHEYLAAHLRLARDPEWGWLTQCPANLGTAMRVSVLLHLPALHLSQRLAQAGDGIAALGGVLRGPWGEQGEAAAGFVSLCNRQSMGKTESELILRVEHLATRLSELEVEATEALLHTAGAELRDAVFRSVAILESAVLLDREELLRRAGFIALGARLGWLPAEGSAKAALLVLLTGEEHLRQAAGRGVQEAHPELDDWRAQVARALWHMNLEPAPAVPASPEAPAAPGVPGALPGDDTRLARAGDATDSVSIDGSADSAASAEATNPGPGGDGGDDNSFDTASTTVLPRDCA